jgi:hypothetical protein
VRAILPVTLPDSRSWWAVAALTRSRVAWRCTRSFPRHAYAEAPPRVEYELTELGGTLIDPITMLAHWAEANGDAILDAQDRA